jgi:uncharacterized protein (TIGR02271 family)
MAKTVIGLFERMQDAQGALGELQSAGLPRNAITFVQHAEPDLHNRLASIGIPEQDAEIYAQGVQHGHGLVVVQGVADTDAEHAATIIDRYNAVDISGRTQPFQRMALDRSAASMRSGTAHTNVYQGDEVALPIIQEELRIGKRQVERGGVRIRTVVREIPVEEQVRLRAEHVDIQRRPVNRPIGEADLAQLQSGMIEVTERAEQAVVSKEARVVEEVVIRKNVDEHVETVRDTVRRTEVDVQQVPGTTSTSGVVETGRVSASDVSTTGMTGSTVGTTGSTLNTASTTGTTTNEGMIEGGASRLGNAAERVTRTDLNRDGDVGQRDPRNNS